MRLIDADVLKEYIDAQKGRPFIGCTIGEALKIMTDEQPTVDAIPHEFIVQFGNTCNDNEKMMALLDLIATWEVDSPAWKLKMTVVRAEREEE